MCEPVSITMGVLAVGGAVMGHMQAQDAADNANEAANIQYDVEVARAKQESMDRQNQLSAEALMESEKIGQQRQTMALEALRAQAAGKVASAEGGLGGVSQIRSFLATDIQSDLARSDVEKSERGAQFNLQQQGRGIMTAKNTRADNAFLTRQSNTRRRPGTSDLLMSSLTAAGPSIGTGVGSILK